MADKDIFRRFGVRSGSHRRIAAALITIGIALTTVGCASQAREPLTDGEQIVLAALRLQAADGRPVCIDRWTAAEPLVTWRTMRVAPRPSRVLIGWSAPRPVRSLNDLTARELIDDQIRGRRIVLREPAAPPRLPIVDQRAYDAAASQLSLQVSPTVSIRDGWGGPPVVARWWPLNRIAPTCNPLYEFSDPVWRDDIGFLTVKSDHWGTTYALRKGPQGWAVVAQWTPWLY